MNSNLTPADIPLNSVLKTQAEQIIDQLDVSESTRRDYKYRIGVFLDFITEHSLTPNTYLQFKRELEGRTDYSVATKNKHLATARILLKELHRMSLIPVDITQNVKAFSQSKKHRKEGFNDEEVRLLVDRIRELPLTPLSSRLRALFCLLAFQGLRQIEIIRLHVSDIDLVSKTALVQGKGKDDKELVHLTPETVRALREYLRSNHIGSGALFRSLGNRHSERITTMTIKREIGKLLEGTGIEKSVHGFRHYYITTLLKKLDVRDVRKFSRHSNLEMLIVYDDELDVKHKAKEVFSCFKNLKVTT